MTDIDKFASDLLEESKRFLEKAAEESEESAKKAYLHAALMLGFCALEAHVNSIAEDMAEVQGITVLELSVLQEKELVLDDGRHRLGKLKIHRLEDRIRFLFDRFGKTNFSNTNGWWPGLSSSMKLRNAVTHPKEGDKVDVTNVKIALESIIQCISALFESIYQKKFPAGNRELNSKLSF